MTKVAKARNDNSIRRTRRKRGLVPSFEKPPATFLYVTWAFTLIISAILFQISVIAAIPFLLAAISTTWFHSYLTRAPARWPDRYFYTGFYNLLLTIIAFGLIVWGA